MTEKSKTQHLRRLARRAGLRIASMRTDAGASLPSSRTAASSQPASASTLPRSSYVVAPKAYYRLLPNQRERGSDEQL